jgi:hypothetical protein
MTQTVSLLTKIRMIVNGNIVDKMAGWVVFGEIV